MAPGLVSDSPPAERPASESLARVPGSPDPWPRVQALVGWLGGTRLGLVAMALVVGAAAGLAAAGFRELIFAFTWLPTGRATFGQQGHIASLHLPGLGPWFVLLTPVVGGLLYGPLVDRFAREARGHGVPEVMVAVAENGGRIRPPVTVVKAFASAICIGFGGSVGREGPIVQIGSALASTLGQVVRMSEARLRIIVACGAAGGIAATFNAPITGLFFGFEIVLREFSFDALFATILGAVTGDIVSRAFFGSAPFFTGIPHGLVLPSDAGYLLIIVLGVASGLVGLGFKTVLYKFEDVLDELWGERPEWLRPAVGGIALGALLLALPELYGVGYPVMDKAFAGHLVVGLIVLLIAGKILATSLTLAIGGSGGVFAPSLFMGAMTGMAFGIGAHDLFGSAVGRPAIYAVVAMGAVFGGAAQAPLTAIASVIEMTGNFTLTLPVMLATGIAAAVSKQLSYGGIYTTKLLRRGVDIERPRPERLLENVTVGELMHPIPGGGAELPGEGAGVPGDGAVFEATELTELIGPVADIRPPQALFAEETLEQALRQLVLYGRSGLPVLSRSGDRVLGWLDDEDVLAAITAQVGVSEQAMEHGAVVADSGSEDPLRRVHVPTTPVEGHALVEAVIGLSSRARGRRIDEVGWPRGSVVVALRKGHEVCAPRPDMLLEPGVRVVLLVPAPARTVQETEAEAPAPAQSPA